MPGDEPFAPAGANDEAQSAGFIAHQPGFAVLALESDAPFTLGELYALDYPHFELALELLRVVIEPVVHEALECPLLRRKAGSFLRFRATVRPTRSAHKTEPEPEKRDPRCPRSLRPPRRCRSRSTSRTSRSTCAT